VPGKHQYVAYLASQLSDMLETDVGHFEDLRLTVTLLQIRPRTSIATLHVVAYLEVDAEFRGARLHRTFAGRHLEEAVDTSPLTGCLLPLMGGLGHLLATVQNLTRNFTVDDVPPKWIECAIDNCLLEVAVELERFVGCESMAVVRFRHLNQMSWMCAALVVAICTGWFAVQGAIWPGLFFGLLLALPMFLTIRLLRPLLLPATFWREEPLGLKVRRAYGVSTVWGMRFLSLLFLVMLATAVYITLVLAR
jgi:hypothetical protein